MNIPQARQTLRRAIPQGEDLLSMNRGEFNWLQANKPDWFGSGKKHKKSGLRSFVPNTPPPGTGSTTPDIKNVLGNTVSGATQDATHKAVADMGTLANPVHGGQGEEGGPPGVPPINTTGITSPGSGSSGHDTRIPAGPGSVTNPNDPHGVQEAVATGAKDLINKEYVAPTLTPEERIAATSADTTAAHDIVRDTTGTGQDQYKEASGVGSEVGKYASDKVGDQSFLSGKGVDEYMSPHTKNVIGGMQENAMRTMQKQRGALQAQHQMAGAGMGSRGALENAAMMGEVQRGLGQQVSGALEDSYAQASDMKKYDMTSARDADKFNVKAGQTDQDIRLRGAKGMVDATDAGRDAAYTDAGMLSNVGAYKEGRDQNVIDEEMGDFYEKRDWGENKLASAANIASTNPTGSTTTTTGAPQHKKKDKFGRIISGAASGWLATGGNPYGAIVGGGMGALS